jgi:hypothetical protein
MSNFQRMVLRGTILLIWFACFRAHDVFGQGMTITTTSPLPDGVVGTAYSQTLMASGGSGSRTWTVVTGSLPIGLSLSSSGMNGLISGTPTTAGTSNFRIRVQAGTASGEKDFVLKINTPVSIVSGPNLPNATQGLAYSQVLLGSGGTTPYNWARTSGSLPNGLSLSGSGTISGTPNSTGTSNFTVSLTDSSIPPQPVVTKAMTIVVVPLTITTASPLPVGVPSTPYSQSLAAANGTAPYGFSIISGSLPAGLTLTNGIISGTPTTLGTSNFTIRVLDSSVPQLSAQKSFTLQIVAALTISTTSPLNSALISVAYPPQNLTATGGTAPYTWSLVSGTLPAGITLSGAVISGTPTAAGTSNFTLRVTDSNSLTMDKAFVLDVVVPLVITTPSPLPSGLPGTPYSQNLSAAGGLAPYSFSVITGALPAGLTLAAGGTLSGTPTTSGVSNFTIRVLDGSTPPQNFQRNFALSINPVLTVTTLSVPAGAVGSSYSTQLQASVNPPLAWSLASGNLPPGISLSGGGLLLGTPTSTGTFAFTVKVTSESPSQEATRSFQIVVGAALSMTTTTTPPGTRFVPYMTTLAATGGVTPYTWTLVSGGLPAGLSLSSAGVISGTPTTVGTSNFSVRVADAGGATVSRGFSIAIIQGVLQITTTSIPGGVQGFAYSQQLEASGGPTPFTWSLAGGALPPGFSLTPAGVLQGNATAPFNGTLSVRVTDATAAAVSRDLTLVIGPPLGTVSLNGLAAKISPAQQMPIAVSLASPYPAELQGTLNLTFASTAVVPVDDPAVQFSTGGRTAKFTIPANTTTGVFSSPAMLAAGTVAGTVTITGAIQNGPSGLQLSSTSVDSTAPQMTNITATRMASGLSVQVIGYSPERRVTEVEYSFDVRVKGNIQKINLGRTVLSEFNTWYQNPASAAFGSSFRLEQLFSVTGDTTAIEGVTVTLKNMQGNTSSARTPFTAP